VRRLAVLCLVVLAAFLTAGAAPSADPPPPPAPSPPAERRIEKLLPTPYDILKPNKKRFTGTGRRHILLEPRSLKLYQDADLLWWLRFDGTAATLEGIAAAMSRSPRPEWLQQSDPGVLTLRAGLVQAPGTSLQVAAPAVKTLRISSETEAYVAGAGASVRFSGVGVTSWNPVTGGPEEDVGSGRPFITYRDSTMAAEGSDFGYLGSDRVRAYGVNWEFGTTGSATGSTFHHNFFGAYTGGAHDVVFSRNVFRDNVLYGLDPHTFTTRLLIEENEAYHNGSHGIVGSHGVTNSTIRANRVYANARNGIVLDRQSNGNVVEGNVVTGNRQDGIVLIASSGTTVRGNTVTGHRVGVRVNKASVGNRLQGNRISRCGKGIEVYGGARQTALQGNVVSGCTDTGVVLEGAASTSVGDVVHDVPTGVVVRAPTTLTRTQVRADGRGLVVDPGGILEADGLSLRAANTAVVVKGPGVARIRASVLEGPRPVAGHLRLDRANRHLARTVPSAGAAQAYLGIAGASFLVLAVLLQLLHRLRNGSQRDPHPTAHHARVPV
jgi:parallel beta-helix repeat protein